MNNKEIGKYLLGKRKSYEMTQADLAEKLNVTYQAVSRWETGESIPDIQTLSAIADLYDVSIDEILQKEAKVKEENPNEDLLFQKIVFFLMPLIHAIGISVVLLFDYFDLSNIGMLGYFIVIVAGLFIHTISYVTIENKERVNFIWFSVSFIWLAISLMVVGIINNVN